MTTTIKKAREAAKLTRFALSYLAGVAPNTLFRLERGLSVQRSSLLSVCRVLNVDPNDIEDVSIFDPWAARYRNMRLKEEGEREK